MEYYIGIDLGGSKTRVGLVSEKGKIVSKSQFETEDTPDFIDRINVAIKQLMLDTDVKSIGIGFPAINKNGTVFDATNLKTWKNVNLKKRLEQANKVPVFVDNDANCFAYGEKIVGSLKPYDNCVAVILGTGVGMGIIINGEIHKGILCGAGEIGKNELHDGTVEDYCSGKFFEKEFNIKGEDIFTAAKRNNQKASKIFYEYGKNLGYALVPIINTIAPEAIVLGGSIAKGFPFFQKSMEQILRINVHYKRIYELVKIFPTKSMDSAIIGAALLGRKKKE
ncbi:ROK family protein [Candidatus Woesearchaeota archaeon]|nr:ROK family protein [Candidatus Woesearchaeota archaeon]